MLWSNTKQGRGAEVPHGRIAALLQDNLLGITGDGAPWESVPGFLPGMEA